MRLVCNVSANAPLTNTITYMMTILSQGSTVAVGMARVVQTLCDEIIVVVVFVVPPGGVDAVLQKLLEILATKATVAKKMEACTLPPTHANLSVYSALVAKGMTVRMGQIARVLLRTQALVQCELMKYLDHGTGTTISMVIDLAAKVAHRISEACDGVL